jgi:energy-coupling factor transport system substrate-specific component
MNQKAKQNSMRVIYVVTMGLLSAILVIGQVGMAALPNIEPVTMLIIAYTLVYRKKVFYIIYAFALIEGIIYGFGIWWLNYLYVWTILAFIVLAMQKNESLVIWCVLAGAYGLCFGFLCSIPYFISGGLGAGFAYWASGIPYDITHCIGNIAVTGLLFKPVYNVLRKMHNSQLSYIQNREKSLPV